jgi:peroxiredoxin
VNDIRLTDCLGRTPSRSTSIRRISRLIACKALAIILARSTFVIDREGTIRHIFESRMNMGAHSEAAKNMVLELRHEKETDK